MLPTPAPGQPPTVCSSCCAAEWHRSSAAAAGSQEVNEGDVLFSGADAPIRPGNTLPLSAIPVRLMCTGMPFMPLACLHLALQVLCGA